MGKSHVPHTYTEIFEEHLPYYLSIGMTWDEYWNGDNQMPKYFRKADRMKRQRDNQKLWMLGAYVYEAIYDLVPVLRFSMSKQAVKPLPYMERPFPLDQKEIEEQREEEERKRAAEIKAKISAWQKRTNTYFSKKGGEQ